MPQNLEVKIPFNSFGEVTKILKRINAEFKGILVQRDVYFKSRNSLLKLRIENGKESLIRYCRNEKSKDRFSDYEVIHFSSAGTEKILNKIFVTEIIVEKKRQLYLFNNTRIHLDKIKRLGNFLELETLVLEGKPDARKRFNRIVKLLKLDLNQQVKKSNYHLMKSYLKS